MRKMIRKNYCQSICHSELCEESSRSFVALRMIIILISLLFFYQPAFAQPICPLNGVPLKPKEIKSLEKLKHIPILENGRVKPLDTYARNFLLRLSGKERYEKEPAIKWFARFLFAPESTRKDKIFLINNPDIPQTLGIEPDKKRRYSFNQIESGFEKLDSLYLQAQHIDKKERDIVETEIIRLYENVKLYSLLSLSFSFAFPHPDFTLTDADTLETLELPDQFMQFSFLDMALRAEKLHALTEPLTHTPTEKWTSSQEQLIKIVSHLYAWAMNYQNLPLTIVPSYVPDDKIWYSPWDALAHGLQKEEGRLEILALRNMMMAYWNGKQLDFDLAAKTFSTSIKTRLDKPGKRALRAFDQEITFNTIQPFLCAKIFYFLAFLLFLPSLASSSRILPKISFSLILAGYAFHVFGLASRIIILTRPPVSSLYETFIFVGFITVSAGLLIEYFNKQFLGIVISSLSGFIFLMIAGKFSVEGDTLQMLIAVLNSNFWLGTHVLSITTGYAGTCVAGIIGHVYILQSIFKPKDQKLLDSTYRTLIGAMGFALTMAFLGTNLGGIWADQSWGRFWGWDPKENGALLIILWLAILFHLRVGKMIGKLTLAAGSVLGIIVVMWAWFGVNLLSIGLHSYGFTSGLAVNLTIYVVLQLLFLGITYPLAKRKI